MIDRERTSKNTMDIRDRKLIACGSGKYFQRCNAGSDAEDRVNKETSNEWLVHNKREDNHDALGLKNQAKRGNKN